MQKYQDLKKQLLKDPDIKREYDLLEPEFAAISQLIELRIKHKLTQKQLAEKIKTKQPAISRFEEGLNNPTVGFLAKVAKVFNKKLVISFR
jgi:DNA-binding XRE family transcriptional regulator